jgi:long-chain fatty acid transport protein
MKGWGRGVSAPAVAIAAVCSSSPANAAGLATARFGGEQGSVVTANPTALYYNPAGIALSEGIHLFLDGQIAIRRLTWDHAPAPNDGDPPGPPQSLGNSGKASLLNVFGAPALGATMKLGNLAFGAGLFVPFGGQEHFSKNSSYQFTDQALAGGVDGVQRWHIIEGQQAFIYATAGVAYRLGPLSAGISGNLIPSMVSFTRAQNLGGNQLPNTESEGRSKLDVSGLFGSFGAGVMFEALPDRLWIGASYQAQPGMGPQTLNGSLAISVGSTNAPTQQVEFHQALPDIWRAGARWRVMKDLELRLLGDYTRWSAMQTQCLAIQGKPCAVFPDGSDASGVGNTVLNVRRNWKDTYHGHLGGSYWLKPEVELFAGAGYETAAVPDTTLEPAIADANNIEGSVGGRFFLFDAFYLAVSYTHLQFLDRDNTGLSILSHSMGPTVQSDGGGKYTQWVGIFDINAEKSF